MHQFRWENPLIGWTSTADAYANVGEAGLSFESEEAAKAFVEKHCWEYVVYMFLPFFMYSKQQKIKV